MKNKNIRLVIMLGALCIAAVILFQVLLVNKSFTMNEKELNQKIAMALHGVAEKMAKFNSSELPNENPVVQLSEAYYIVNINDIIIPEILDHYLKTEFEYRNLDIPYEYAIYDCESDKMVFQRLVETRADSSDISELFPLLENFTYYFGINFPSNRTHILESMILWIASGLLIIIALVFFVYTLVVILNQRRLSEMQRDFINNMTHEFKTPLSTIGISAEVLADPDILLQEERHKNYVDIIKEQTIRLNRHTEQVLQMGRIDKKGIPLHRKEIMLLEFLHEIESRILNAYPDKNLNIEITSDDIRDTTSISADSAHLTNVLMNLVDNGIKYSTNDPFIKIHTGINRNKLNISVEDKGIGIEKKFRRKVFRKFFRIPTGNVHNVKGFGLGLSYVRKIVKAHGWKIRLISVEGAGSTFSIIIPGKYWNL